LVVDHHLLVFSIVVKKRARVSTHCSLPREKVKEEEEEEVVVGETRDSSSTNNEQRSSDAD
jgi:hypothetical protein